MFQRYRIQALVVALASVFAGSVSAGDLVAHNGFSECWTHAITTSLFYSAARTVVDGRTGCVPPQSGTSPIPYTVCNTAACPGGQMGCPVALHAPAAPSGDFSNGNFSGTGTADNLSVPITYTLGTAQSCTMQITAVALTYAWTNTLTADGNNGRYAADLPSNSVTFNQYTLGGNCNATVTNFLGPTAITQAQSAAATALKPDLTAATVDESICPLP